MTMDSEPFPLVPSEANPAEVAANISATDRLLGMLRAEAARPQALIGKCHEFRDDGSFDLSLGPPLAETVDPGEIDNGYLAGIRPSDGAGQVIVLEREMGGVVGRVIVTLREGQPTFLSGERRVPWRPEFGLTRKVRLDGQLAPAALLDQLGSRLEYAFDTKRARMAGESSVFRRLLARFVRAVDSADRDQPRQLEW